MKTSLSDIVVGRIRKIIFLLLFVCTPIFSKAYCYSVPDTLQEKQTPVKKENLFWKVVNFVEMLLEQDTTYVSPDKYNLRLMPQYTYGYEYYHFSSPDNEQSITIAPTSSNKLGLYGGWRWLFFGYNFTFNKIRPEFDFEASLFCVRAGIELFYRKRSDGFKIHSLKGFHENDLPLTNFNRDFDGLAVSQFGASVSYIFNYRHFSYPAAFCQTTNQRKNAGSFILGLEYNEQTFMFDHTKIDQRLGRLMKLELQFQNASYKDICINLGYSYNWVFAKNFVANITASPAIGYKNTSLKPVGNSKEFISNINIDLVSRLALTYNNNKYYAGASLISHTYSYINPEFSILNGFGYIKVYAGFNFWRRKQN